LSVTHDLSGPQGKVIHYNFKNFQVICELIDQQHHGIMALLDEACLNVGNTTDPMLLEHMDKKLKASGHYASRSSDSTTKKKNLELHQVKILKESKL